MLRTLAFCIVIFFFFFQAEDGIRDLVRSRGLGDVYKRQVLEASLRYEPNAKIEITDPEVARKVIRLLDTLDAVSYTHLTLPTSDLV